MNEITITVCNVRTHKRTNNDVYCGRATTRLKGSPLANPYYIGREGNRARVIAKYYLWLREQVLSQSQPAYGAFVDLCLHALNKPLNLICWCHPLDCHCRVLKEAIEGVLAEEVREL